MSNPHLDWMNRYRNAGNTLTPRVEATLALAYEQRTANLIAFLATQPLSGHNTTSATARRDYIKLHATLVARLGLGDAK